MRLFLRLILWAAIFSSLTTIVLASDSAEQRAIRHVMMKTWDKPDARLVVDPIVVADDHAVAGWSQGEMGGRALLRMKSGAWEVVLCAGDDLKKVEAFKRIGLNDELAISLANDVEKAERSIPPARLALFSRFEGLVVMGASGGHPHQQK